MEVGAEWGCAQETRLQQQPLGRLQRHKQTASYPSCRRRCLLPPLRAPCAGYGRCVQRLLPAHVPREANGQNAADCSLESA
jgi:hypothetical protein